MQASVRYRRWAVGFLVYTVFVILWGALVRATLSGDGCGDHWPLCNGEVVPVAPAAETLIELTHRITSGLAWIGALAFVLVAQRLEPGLQRVRRGARWVLFFMTTEALVGAGLVLFRMVAENPDEARGYWAAAHLANTLLLLAASTLHVWYAYGGRRLTWTPRWMAVIAGWVLLGASGAIAALGDTLFPVNSLAEGFAQDLSPSSHVFLRLRTFHPLIAIAVTAGTLFAGAKAIRGDTKNLALLVGALLIAQVGLGFLNVTLLAPIWLQLVHLALADTLWIALIWLAARDQSRTS
ncbi:MAG: COX15/CtaA family protein [Myxococcota bacterium]